jgi:hypothetical protein
MNVRNSKARNGKKGKAKKKNKKKKATVMEQEERVPRGKLGKCERFTYTTYFGEMYDRAYPFRVMLLQAIPRDGRDKNGRGRQKRQPAGQATIFLNPPLLQGEQEAAGYVYLM